MPTGVLISGASEMSRKQLVSLSLLKNITILIISVTHFLAGPLDVNKSSRTRNPFFSEGSEGGYTVARA